MAGFEKNGQPVMYNFTFEEIIELQALDMPRGPEPADHTVFYYASKLEAIVLSGDNKLGNIANPGILKLLVSYGYSINL
ncbi:hypothetical protein ACCC92_24020 [Mucilaginibacter sp. Mucisp84]|uniref:hypothetical protein n=1 Tax=Mucilaginibacter sp. Mucisp84 TaxID=3243058 RepID=UPI0039A78018